MAKYIEYVAKEEVIELLRSYGDTGEDIPFHVLDDSIFEMKSADVTQVRHGHWIYHPDDLFPNDSTQECSYCHAEESLTLYNENYCPNCGARMDEVIE